MSDHVELKLEPLGRSIALVPGTPLRAVLHDYGVEFPCGGRGRCRGCRVRQIGGALPIGPEDAVLLTPAELESGWRLACRATVESDLTLDVGQWRTVILADHSEFEFEPREGLGVVVDLGTTTVVAQLLDLRTARVLAVRTAVNPQTVHGSDVMSRIQLSVEGGERGALVEELRRGVGRMLKKLLAAARLEAPRLESVVLTGNTVMHHLFCGIDLEPLAHTPFETPAKEERRFRARELGWRLPGDPAVLFLPCLGGFVGSDILCGILATKMHESAAPCLLYDLGTNGEIVIGNRERMICVSTAAGPAFEGGRIRMGMRATTGAIHEVTAVDGALRCRVLGEVEPRGVCGSGLVDAVAAGLELGWIEPSGRLVNGRKLPLASPVELSQGDIRQLQLAKAAIATGAQVLRARFALAEDASLPTYLAGAFGNYVSRTSARRIGLLTGPEEAIHPAGNTALLGAKIALFSSEADAGFAELRGRIEHLPLAADPEFEDAYVGALAFPANVA
jgi:uncharacterized 2Fe-2S/4Fe-4S cluster protein (DUF4445 family)